MFRIVHNMLTETRNKHFSERLFYADSLSLMRAVQINITWTTTIKNPNKK